MKNKILFLGLGLFLIPSFICSMTCRRLNSGVVREISMPLYMNFSGKDSNLKLEDLFFVPEDDLALLRKYSRPFAAGNVGAPTEIEGEKIRLLDFTDVVHNSEKAFSRILELLYYFDLYQASLYPTSAAAISSDSYVKAIRDVLNKPVNDSSEAIEFGRMVKALKLEEVLRSIVRI